MIDIEKLILRAVNDIDISYQLPKKGLLAGGALANTILSYTKEGYKPIINDIDIFLLNIEEDLEFNGFKNYDKIKNIKRNNLNFVSLDIDKRTFKRTRYTGEEYDFIKVDYYTDNFYYIDYTENVGIFNKIYYNCKEYNPQFLIDNFDINACCVAYDLETKICYYNKSFIKFIETNELAPIKLNTPSHTILRLYKKKDELKANLDEEKYMTMLQNVLFTNFRNYAILHFNEKRYEQYLRYKDDINKYFGIIKVKLYGDYLYRFIPKRYSEILENKHHINESFFVRLNNDKNFAIKYLEKFCPDLLHMTYIDEVEQYYFNNYKDYVPEISSFYYKHNSDSNILNKETLEWLKTLQKDSKHNINNLIRYAFKQLSFSDMNTIYNYKEILKSENWFNDILIDKGILYVDEIIQPDIMLDKFRDIIIRTVITNRERFMIKGTVKEVDEFLF